jgi:DNA-binding transcriptional LysR family regulator
MEINQLLSFYEIAKTGSFSKASEKVFRTQPAVSSQIKNLEKELNVKLFERQPKRIRLTKEGELLFNIIRNFFTELEKLKKIYEDMQHGKGGSLIIAASPSIMRYVLPNVMATFMKRFPKNKFKLIACRDPSEIESLLREGEVDLAIGPKINQSDEHIDFLFWKSFDMLLISAKHHPISRKKNITLADISHYPLIVCREGVLRGIIERPFIHSKLPFDVIIELDMAEYVKIYAEMGIGIAFFSSITLTEEDRNRFSIRNVKKLFGKVDYGITLRRNKYVSMQMSQFVRSFMAFSCPERNLS